MSDNYFSNAEKMKAESGQRLIDNILRLIREENEQTSRAKLTTLRKELDALIEKNQKGYDYTISQDSRFSGIYYMIIEDLKKIREML